MDVMLSCVIIRSKFKYEMKNRKGCANGLLLCILFFEINIILNEVLKSLLNL